MEPDKKSDLFQFTLSKLLSLSKIEMRRIIILAFCVALALTCVLSAVIVATVLQLSIHFSVDQLSIFIFVASVTLIVFSIIAVRSARLSVIRLKSVIELAKDVFSFSTQSSSNDSAHTNLSSIASANFQARESEEPQLHQTSAQISGVSNDRLPRTAARFYRIIEQSKSSVIKSINQFIEPISEVKGFVKSQPVLSVGAAAIVGNFLAQIIFKPKKL
jgi:hypothetical protein